MQHNRDRLVVNIVTAIALVLLFAYSSAFAIPVTDLRFSGNVHILSAELVTASIAAPNPIDRDFRSASDLIIATQEIESRIIQRYRREGFLFAAVDSSRFGLAVPGDSSQGVILTLFIKEGIQYTLKAVRFIGVLQPAESDLQNQLHVSPGEPLNDAALKTDINAILKHYATRGLPFAKIDVGMALDTDHGKGEIAISLSVTEGHSARIGRIVVEGNTSTNREVIVRELRIPIGTVYDPDEVERARERLERLGYFESVMPPDLYLIDDSTVALVVRVKEANTSQVDGVLGYNPARTPTESGYISGSLELGFRNISGTARDAALHYSRETSLTQVLDVRYLEPWLFGYPLNLQLSYSQRQQDTSYTQSSIGGALILSMKENLSLELSTSLDRVIPTDLPGYPFIAYDSRSVVTGLTGTFDSRDDPYAARSGVRAVLGASYAVKTINGPARFVDSVTPASQGLHTILIDGAGFEQLGAPRVVGMLALHAASVGTPDGLLDQSDLFRLGGFRSIRGYREGELEASRYAYGTVELRYMTGRQSFFFGFLDGGVLVKDSAVSSPSEQVLYPLSYGLGIQMESPLGLISVAIALAKGDPFDQAKFHLGLVKQF